ncbi:MAG: J domain-containing protein [Desulfurellales bacterium]|nr:MAG: J domain-containing protein [Desulfurellales bacterium]
MTENYPLHWPANRSRTLRDLRQNSSFKVPSFGRVRDELMRELSLLGAKNIVLSTNVPVRLDGLPYSGMRQPEDTGVAVYFTHGKRQMAFACDRWHKVEDNLRAVQRTIEALRGIERWGSGDMLEAAFTGFQALPAPAAGRDWSSVLGCPKDSPLDIIENHYRDLVKKHHPDAGGSAEKMAELNAAIAQARKDRS